LTQAALSGAATSNQLTTTAMLHSSAPTIHPSQIQPAISTASSNTQKHFGNGFQSGQTL